MPHYHFHVSDSHGELPDAEGRELLDLAAARRAALEGARSLICEDVGQGRLNLNGILEVTDATGEPLFELSFREAVGAN